jgi:excisionase family DNA binding protein
MQTNSALSVIEAARMLGVGRSTLYGLIRQGHLPIRKLGKRTLILKTELEAFINALPSASDKGS